MTWNGHQTVGALANLPPPGTTRWVASRKAQIVAAVRGGILSFSGACQRYGLTSEELLLWQDAMRQSGEEGLRATRPHRPRVS